MKKCKPKKCSECPVMFQPWKSTQTVCSLECSISRVNRLNEKRATSLSKKEERRRKRVIRAKKDGLKTKSKWLAEAQVEFNRFIRLRDVNEPCISCGRYDHEIIDRGAGGKWDCGHWKTRGAFPELRFVEDNAHKQCKSCNGGSGKYTKKNHTVGKQYKENLIKKIGLERVEILEGYHEPKHYSIDDIKNIKQYYRQQTKIIKG